jgi:hypothetical protein
MTAIQGIKQTSVQSDVWTPARLFMGGETGFWLDAKDPSTMRQNSGGTGAVGDGDPVGWWTTKAGTSLTFTQATSGLRPTYTSANGLVFVTETGTMLRATGITPWARHGLVAFAFFYTNRYSYGTDPRIVSVKSSGTEDYNTDGNFTFNARAQFPRLDFLINLDPSTTQWDYSYNTWAIGDATADSDTLPNNITPRLNAGSVDTSCVQPASTPVWNFISIGARDPTAETFDGYIGDVVYRQEIPKGNELARLRNFLSAKYMNTKIV